MKKAMNTPERWSTASSDSDLSSIFGSGKSFPDFSETPGFWEYICFE